MRKAIVAIATVAAAVVAVHGSSAAPAPQDKAYTAIDGKHLKEFVDDQTAISRRYRDAGHQFWGRISGTEADKENAQWLLDKFRKIGLADVHEQPFDLPPQWMPQSWSVAASGGGKTLDLQSAQPTNLTPGTAEGGLDLEAVDVGFASDADLAGRDLKGKAVFFYSTDVLSRQGNVSGGVIKRIESSGAAAVFMTLMIPGNLKLQFYPVEAKVPVFSLGLDDGLAAREMIGHARGGQAAHVKLKLDVKMVPNMKTAMIWGSLPGTSDENIIIVAHRDAWFEGANDNASGVATLLGLAEYFASVPKEQRRRTITFLGTSGHHDEAAMSGHWLAAHKEMFAKTALLINAEHTAEAVVDILRDGTGASPYGVLRVANTAATKRWYVGSPRLRQIALAAYGDFGVPIYDAPDAAAGGEIGLYYRYAPALQIIGGRYYWHSDKEGSNLIPASAIAAVTRAYAKVIDGVNGVDLKDLRPDSE